MILMIRQERLQRGWSQEKVAKRLGLTQSMLLKIETGKRRPSFDVLVKLEDLFGMNYRDLFNISKRQIREDLGATTPIIISERREKMQSNNDAYYSGPVKEEFLTHCEKCGKEVDKRWDYCPCCGEKVG